jgi:lysophospholipase L1-like esterase
MVVLPIVLVIFLLLGLLMAVLGTQQNQDCASGATAGNNNTQTAFNFLAARPGMGAVQAGAVVGNLIHESAGDGDLSVNPTAENPRSHAYGIAQWLGGRLTALQNHQFVGPEPEGDAQKDWKTDITYQLDFLWDELKYQPAVSGNALALIQQTNSITKAVALFEGGKPNVAGDGFERSGDVASYPQRIKNAISVLQKYGASAPSAGQNLPSSASPSGSVYVLGDSIALGAKQQLIDALGGSNVYIDASKDRSIMGAGVTPGFRTSGLDALEEDANKQVGGFQGVSKATVIIIELGTNDLHGGAAFEARIRTLVGKIRGHGSKQGINTQAALYWVKVFSGGPVDRQSLNTSIESLADSLDYTPIKTGSGIDVGSDGVHPTSAGNGALAQAIASQVAPAPTTNALCDTAGVSAGLANPFPKGWEPGRLDMGYDGTFKDVLVAPFAGTITYASNSFSNWGGYVELKAHGPVNGLPTQTLFFAEGLVPVAQAGQDVSAGQLIALPTPSRWNGTNGNIEWGVAQDLPSGVKTGVTDTYAKVASDPRQMVLSFAQWAVQTLHLPPPSKTDQAGYP